MKKRPRSPRRIEQAEAIAAMLRADGIDAQALRWLSASEERAWGLACSGGADSVALLFLVRGLFPEKNLCVLHFNHRTRGEFSDADAAFVRKLAAEMGCDFREGAWDEPSTKATEAQLREARFRFFKYSLAFVPSQSLILGHQQNDVAEQLLMRLARGSHLGGLCSPRPLQQVGTIMHIRPLLTISHERLIQALKLLQIPWQEDLSNQEESPLRNRIRKHIIPQLTSLNHSNALLPSMAQSRTFLQESDDALDAWLSSLDWIQGKQLNLSALEDKPCGLIRRALHRWLLRVFPEHALSLQAINGVLQAIMLKKAFTKSLSKKFFLVSDTFFLSICSEKDLNEGFKSIYWNLEGRLVLPSGASIQACIVELSSELREEIVTNRFSQTRYAFLSVFPEGVTVRAWEAGDRYQPMSATKALKLKDLFANYKIASTLRRQLPLLCHPEKGILWCPGLPPARFAWLSQNNTRALRITYTEPSKTNHI